MHGNKSSVDVRQKVLGIIGFTLLFSVHGCTAISPPWTHGNKSSVDARHKDLGIIGLTLLFSQSMAALQ